MSDFEAAFQYMFPHEKGYADDKDDKGGETFDGLSIEFLKLIGIDEEKARNLTPQEKKDIYKKYFWDKYELSKISSQDVANYLFDMFVNHSEKGAVKIIQNSINDLGDESADLIVDGIMGEITKIFLFRTIRWKDFPKLLILLKYHRARYYLSIVDNNPSQIKFLHGWMKRALK